MIKRVVSVSLGSPRRDHEEVIQGPCCRVLVRRTGTGGDLRRAAEILKSLDGKVDALGLGGVNLSLRVGSRRYQLRDGARLASLVCRTPLVDGSGIKDTLEQDLVPYLWERLGWPRRGQTVLVTSVLDRYALAAALAGAGCRLIIGDALFALGLPVPFYSLETFQAAARLTLPWLSRLPIGLIYPLGRRQEQNRPRFERFFRQADLIAGDFHFLRYRLPADLGGKDIITSTITAADVQELRNRGVRWLVTASPSFGGRSFGSNVLEAICAALLGDRFGESGPASYPGLLRELKWEPRVEKLN